MSAMSSQITSFTIVYSTVYSGADQRKHQSSASLAFVRGIHRWPVNSPHKGPVTRKMFPFDDVIMTADPRCTYDMAIKSRDSMTFKRMLWNNQRTPFFSWISQINSPRVRSYVAFDYNTWMKYEYFLDDQKINGPDKIQCRLIFYPTFWIWLTFSRRPPRGLLFGNTEWIPHTMWRHMMIIMSSCHQLWSTLNV